MKFKVGDRVRVVSNNSDFHRHSIGEIGIVTDIDDDDDTIEVSVDTLAQWIDIEDLELIYPKFKVGDRIRSKKTGATGTIYSILGNDLWCRDWSDEHAGRQRYIYSDRVELIEPEIYPGRIMPTDIPGPSLINLGNTWTEWTTTYSDWNYDKEPFTINKPKTIMTKLSNLAKRLLDADTKTLVKAGYLNSELDMTNEGRLALWALLVQANKVEMVKLANEKIAEDEKDEN